MDITKEPALPTRAAKSIILICIGILLLSACGWAPPGPRLTPIQFEDFVLWQTTPGLPPAIMGSGRIEGSTSNFTAYSTIFPSSCTAQRRFVLRGGTLLDATTVAAHAEPWPNQPDPHLTVDLGGVVRTTRGRPSLLPLAGSMTIDNWCNGRLALNLEARPGPDLKHYWNGGAMDSTRRWGVRLTLNQTNPDSAGHAWLWGDLHLDAPCNADGFLAPQIVPNPAPQPTSATFPTQTGATITLTNLPTTLNPDPPAEFQTTVHIAGGTCDGQSFPITLTSR